MQSARLQEMPASERPREKAERLGFAALSDAELLAIFIRTGVPGRDALQVAGDLLRDCGGFTELARRTPSEIRRKSKGIGPAKSLEMAAAFEIGRRLARGASIQPLMDTPQRVFDAFGAEMLALRQESLRVLMLDAKLRLLRAEEIARGSVNECLAHPREIFRHAVVHSAYAVVVIHNHPSGDPSPSSADYRVTRILADAARLLQINLLDHIILGSADGGRTPYFSFREAGAL
ncbi:MAG: DNA repair protein RadC [Verrucomicrobia bacterium]|nr:DNA repair protein RadC [Verrucomicrobiota bacterium]